MKLAIIFLIGLFAIGCDHACDRFVVFDLDQIVSTGTGGSDGSGGGSSGTGGGNTDLVTTCEYSFAGSHTCVVADLMCCLIGKEDLSKRCIDATDGTMPSPVLCSETPEVGPATDDRACVVIADGVFTCEWGVGQLLCCE